MELTYNVLDKGYVKYIRHIGDDLTPVEDARMSTGNPTGIDDVKDNKLRRYLWNNQHTSPFEGCVLTIELKVPLIILNQMDRHRTLDANGGFEIVDYSDFRKYTARNGFSGRYAEHEEEFYIPFLDRIHKQDEVNKQGSIEGFDDDDKYLLRERFSSSVHNSFETYQYLISSGVAKELARMVLPSCIYTKMRFTANLLNWFKFLKLRLDKHAQYEIREYAIAISFIIKELWPKCWDIFESYSERDSFRVDVLQEAFKILLGHINYHVPEDYSPETLQSILTGGLGEANMKELMLKLDMK